MENALQRETPACMNPEQRGCQCFLVFPSYPSALGRATWGRLDMLPQGSTDTALFGRNRP